MNINYPSYLADLGRTFPELVTALPWHITSNLLEILRNRIRQLPSDYNIEGECAIHHSAMVEAHTVIKGPVILGPNCFIGSHAYLRGGVYLGSNVSIGPGCELKTTLIFDNSALAHFNFAGDSIIGRGINMEAGSILANYHNDRDDKTIRMNIDGKEFTLDITKFGSLLGDFVKIGANAVCAPGTFLPPRTIVKRLELIEQDKKS